MNSKKLYGILKETTEVYRKGAAISEKYVGDTKVTEIYNCPHSSQSPNSEKYEKVDMVFVDVLVDREKAEQRKSDLEGILAEYPQPDRLAGGPSYIELSPNCGLEQEGGLRLMALGKVLGLWDVVSGKSFGLGEAETLELAGNGLLMITGYGVTETESAK